METNAFLKALTPEAQAALDRTFYRIPKLPFRVGRESRVHPMPDFADSRRGLSLVPNNDLYLRETEQPLNVSREHFQIERRGGNFYYLVDRGSACGTLVEGAVVGGNRMGGERRLEDGDVIIVGTSGSAFVFKFLIYDESQ